MGSLDGFSPVFDKLNVCGTKREVPKSCRDGLGEGHADMRGQRELTLE